MEKKVMQRDMLILFPCYLLLATFALAENMAPFNSSPLIKLGDTVSYGSYKAIRIGDGIYQINDPGD
jgi:hypothetical protein